VKHFGSVPIVLSPPVPFRGPHLAILPCDQVVGPACRISLDIPVSFSFMYGAFLRHSSNMADVLRDSGVVVYVTLQQPNASLQEPFHQTFYPFNRLTPNDTYRGRTAPLTSKVAFYIFIQIYVLNILNTVYTLRFFSSKCSLFHNFKVFCSCIIHILYTGCAKIKNIIPAPKG